MVSFFTVGSKDGFLFYRWFKGWFPLSVWGIKLMDLIPPSFFIYKPQIINNDHYRQLLLLYLHRKNQQNHSRSYQVRILRPLRLQIMLPALHIGSECYQMHEQ